MKEGSRVLVKEAGNKSEEEPEDDVLLAKP